eukprot:TRINITY_DN4650_c0_g1_i2.p1 TRINITY_DN4650_c0_g1~~TRINITY_DN4650_c0_g1_i2.p1  ORF type:complete len:131 (+),score=14.70 TRINITY_DN4650_c0_g1_i2:976-1368(+)
MFDDQPTAEPEQQSQRTYENIGGYLLSEATNIFNKARNLLPANKLFPITSITRALMENKPHPQTERYITLDPKSKSMTSKSHVEFQEAIVFMIGGGNYVEYQNLQDYATGKFSGQSLSNIQGLNLSSRTG